MKKISTTVSDEFHAQVKQYCEGMGEMPMGVFMRHTMVQYMNRHPKKQKDIKK